MDRFFRGLLSGIAGGIVMNIWSFFSYHILNFTKLRFVDWASIMLFGHLPQSLGETLYALIIHILWAGFLAVIFAYLIPFTTSRGYVIKALFYGLISGFIIYSIPRLFTVPNLTDTPLSTVISNHIGGTLWALTMVYMLRQLDHTPKIIR